ncbi:Retrovirus-related Pol polyprotein from transposon 17.6 [Trichinella sp. T9]|nr:Retrovirus-related Pol polyprotein from transposon 17.6 [Trichinella sp. T9]
MLFGLCNALATFQKLMHTGLRGLVGSECLVYLDDVIVFGKTAEEHTARLCEVFRGLREVGLKVKPEKCQLMKRKQNLCIARVADNDLRGRVATVPGAGVILPRMAYFCKFVNGFVNTAAPLHRLLETGSECGWSEVWQSAFDTLNSPGRQRTRLQSGAEKERRKNGEGCAVRELHADQGRVSVMRDSEENAQFGVSPLPTLVEELQGTRGEGSPMAGNLGPVVVRPAGRSIDLTTAAVIGWRELTNGMPPECSHDMHVLWQQRRCWMGEDGLICRYRRRLMDEEGANQLLEPRALRREVVQSMDDNAGTSQKLILLAWNELRRAHMVLHVHAACEEEGPAKNNRAPMQPMTAGYPLQRVSIDILGPLERTPPGDSRCHGQGDGREVRCVLGAPDYLHSDQGCSFEASVVLNMCHLFSIRKSRSSPYYPQVNRQAERFNSTLLYMLSFMVDGNLRQWDGMLPFVMLAYNSSVHERKGVTPIIVIFS